MPNHVHFIAVPENVDSMAKVFKYAHMKYSQHYNKKMNTQGHLFQGRFFSSVMDERYTLACARYIERNPVRAKMTKDPCLFEWSSAKIHCGIQERDELGVNKLFKYIEETQDSWKQFIELTDGENEISQIREKTRKGRPLGTSIFLEGLEKKLNRFLTLRSKGRPKKRSEK